jgi:hypothetical protein
MNPSVFATIDWDRPWLLPVRNLGMSVLHGGRPWRHELNELAEKHGLCNHRGLPLRFVPQADLPGDTAYETYISNTGGVPTRDNLHDFFNALIWFYFPDIKRQLNRLQADEIARHLGVPIRRGVARDVATIFDENAAIFVTADSSLVDALREHQWKELFVDRRSEFQTVCEVRLFGHALIEKLVTPFKAITAHAWPVIVDCQYFSWDEEKRRQWLDHTISPSLQSDITMRAYSPLPVLGLPGWHEHQDDNFYGDVTVFRPKRRQNMATR